MMRLTLALASMAVGVALPITLAGPASAGSRGGLDFLPSTGNAETPMSVITERGCAEPAKRVSAIVTGNGFPEDGQVVLSPSEVLFSTTRPMELPLSNAFVVYADRNATALSGTYTITVRCTDRVGVTVLDTFSSTMVWKTPGNAKAKVRSATYVAKDTAGVLEAQEKAAAKAQASAAPNDQETPAPSAAPSADGSDSAGPAPGEQPLANDELPDGSNPNVFEPSDSATSSTSSSPQRWIVLGAAALALLGALVLFFKGRRPSST